MTKCPRYLYYSKKDLASTNQPERIRKAIPQRHLAMSCQRSVCKGSKSDPGSLKHTPNNGQPGPTIFGSEGRSPDVRVFQT